ncbi:MULTISPECIES: glutathione S-transferase family protein [Vibrio]|uniref:glutathione transferase n=2 Tax=Vibrio TaxID=662 RepID=A0A7X4LJJ0_9VIBR|nr:MULTISPECIES: glutathione S-transferase family protein [Vibrio]MBF9003354.1 glutathione S-transferase family protein [Vibrio nitrifigilis]MZI93118.1 glutathione S-transferase [Vibrio eleionomae]
MITLHHLNKSRSKRIIWLLEELGVDYQIKAYQRDSKTQLAPQELKEIHPLGKSPVIDEDGFVLAESGAIIEYLAGRFAENTLVPEKGTQDYALYLQWLHFAESSAMVPTLLKIFLALEPNDTQFLDHYAQVELEKVMGYLNQELANKAYLVGNKLSGADIIMSFIPEVLQQLGALQNYPNLQRYYATLSENPHFQKANKLEAQYDTQSA